ncbi:hypothetical protein ACFQ0B_44245 [Nonomuraea thailandensis]
MREQQPDAVDEDVDGGLLTGDEQELHHRDELVAVESVTLRLQRDELGEQVVLGDRSAAPGQLVEVGGEGQRRRGIVVGRGDDDRRPLAEPGAVLLGDPDELGDDVHGQGIDQVGHSVERAQPAGAGDQPVRDAGDPRLQPRDRPGREGRADEPAQPGVVGWIELDELARRDSCRLAPVVLRDHVRSLMPEHFVTDGRVPQAVEDVGMARHDPEPVTGRVDLRDGPAGGPYAGVERVRVAARVGLPQLRRPELNSHVPPSVRSWM